MHLLIYPIVWTRHLGSTTLRKPDSLVRSPRRSYTCRPLDTGSRYLSIHAESNNNLSRAEPSPSPRSGIPPARLHTTRQSMADPRPPDRYPFCQSDSWSLSGAGAGEQGDTYREAVSDLCPSAQHTSGVNPWPAGCNFPKEFCPLRVLGQTTPSLSSLAWARNTMLLPQLLASRRASHPFHLIIVMEE